MQWWQLAALGGVGGALVEVLAVFKYLATWQQARRTPSGRVSRRPPPWQEYLDLAGHASVGVLRLILGAVAAGLFGATGQITGAYAAVAFGFAAPSVLAQLGGVPQVAEAVRGKSPEGQSSPKPANARESTQ